MWAADGDNQWLLLCLKEPCKVDHAKLAFQSTQRNESYFDILGSEDNVVWEQILTKSNSCGFSGNLQVFDFPASKTETAYSFIKLIGHCNSANSWNYISEFKLFGTHNQSLTYKDQNRIVLYPNPAHDYINILIKESSFLPEIIRISDLSGFVVFEDSIEAGTKELQIPIDFMNGIYIVQLYSHKLIYDTQKLIVKK